MTLPRRFLKGTTYWITRRCTQRQFWLKPTPQTNQIFLYCLAIAAERTGVIVHAACVMSNHWHVIVTDPYAEVAAFYGWVHKYVAKAVNASLGRWENLWSSDKTNVVVLESQQDVWQKLLYTLCNPVEARLVATAAVWPGVLLYKEAHSKTVKRPTVYFRTIGDLPAEAKLSIQPPPQLAHLSHSDYEMHVDTALSTKEARIAEQMRQNGQSFMGKDWVLKQRHGTRPNNFEPRRGLNPSIACRNKVQRKEAIQRNKVFQIEYRKAYTEFRAGNRDVVFPAGTYALRVFANVKCKPG